MSFSRFQGGEERWAEVRRKQPTSPSHKLLMRLSGHHGDVTSLMFSPDGLMLATGCSSGWLNIWSLQVTRRFRE